MDESDIVSHLLDVEGQAYTLVAEAQTEADRRNAERVKNLREKYEKIYAERRVELTRRYEAETIQATAEHDAELADYREDLIRHGIYPDRFKTVLELRLNEACRDR